MGPGSHSLRGDSQAFSLCCEGDRWSLPPFTPQEPRLPLGLGQEPGWWPVSHPGFVLCCAGVVSTVVTTTADKGKQQRKTERQAFRGDMLALI